MKKQRDKERHKDTRREKKGKRCGFLTVGLSGEGDKETNRVIKKQTDKERHKDT